MSNSGKAQTTPPKDLEQILDFHCWSIDKTKDENREHIAGLKAALLAWSDRRTLAEIKELLNLGVYAERASYLHAETPPNLNWPIINQPVYIVPASAVSDLAKPDFYNNKDVSNPHKPALEADGGGDERS